MRTNLSSQISLNRVSTRYYKPENTIERSVLTRFEKIPTNIYETVDEGVSCIADEIIRKVQERQRDGKFVLLLQVPVHHFARCLRNWFADIRKKV